MGKRWRVIIILASTALMVGAAWQILRPREPVFEGKPLSFWLSAYDPDLRTEPGAQKADEVMDVIGTNAVPTLLRMLRAKDSPLMLKFIALAQRQDFIFINHDLASNRNFKAMEAFKRLGPKARTAVPALIEIYQQNLSAISQCATAAALGSMGSAAKDAIPTLLCGITNIDVDVRCETAYALSQLHAESALVVPTLIKWLHDPDPEVRTSALLTLENFGADAKSAVASLLPLLNDPGYFAHLGPPETTIILKSIDPNAAASNADLTSPAK
jgi:HEAT repeat protein